MSQRNVKSVPRSPLDGLSHWLIQHAAWRAPESLSERLEEEWLADCAERRTAGSRLRFAVGCCWATRVIAYEHPPLGVPVSGVAHARHDFGYISRRSSTFFLVVSLHVALFYGLVTAVTHTHGKVIPPPLQNQVLENPHPSPLPLLPEPTMKDVRIEAPIPVVDVDREMDPTHNVTAEFVREPSPTQPPSSPPASAHVATKVQGGPGAGFPNPDDYYPALSRYKEEQGVATVQVCVDVAGRLTAGPTMLQSAGSTRLDEGALQLARAGSGHYRATTEDGRGVNSCYPLRIRFQIKN